MHRICSTSPSKIVKTSETHLALRVSDQWKRSCRSNLAEFSAGKFFTKGWNFPPNRAHLVFLRGFSHLLGWLQLQLKSGIQVVELRAPALGHIPWDDMLAGFAGRETSFEKAGNWEDSNFLKDRFTK